MDGKKMAKVLLLIMVFDLLFSSATDAEPWFYRRRSSRRRRRRRAAVTAVTHCSSSTPSGFAWANTWHEYFTRRCPKNYSLKYWYSIHRNCKEDRIHYFQCGYGPVQYHAKNCAWVTHYQNDFDQPLTFKCNFNGFITGVASEYNSYNKDRRFSFRCCHVPGYHRLNCKLTPYQNNWDEKMEYRVPSGYYLVGAYSYHHNYYEDRRWKFEICQITKSAGK